LPTDRCGVELVQISSASQTESEVIIDDFFTYSFVMCTTLADGSGRLISLPKKSYCPWKPENVERASRDERLEKERSEKQQQEQAQEAAAEKAKSAHEN
jgi:hypothetical protein